jgi:hypothetical protein
VFYIVQSSPSTPRTGLDCIQRKGKSSDKESSTCAARQSAETLTSDNIGNGGGGDEDEPQASCGDGGTGGGAEKPVTRGS